MNKLFTKIVGLCLGLTMAVGVGTAVAFNGIHKEAVEAKAETSTYVWAPTSKIDSGTTTTYDTVAWTLTTGNAQGYQSGYAGLQYGTKSSPSYVTITSANSFSYSSKTLIKSVTIYANTGGSASVTSFTIGGESQALSGSITKNSSCSGDYNKASALTFTNTSGITGAISFTITGTSAACYFCAIKVVVDENGSSKTLDHISVGGIMSKTDYNTAESWDPTGLTVTAYYDDGTDSKVTTDAEWSFSPLTPADAPLGETSVTATATYQEKTNSKSQTVTVTEYVADSYEKVTSAPTDWSGEYLLVYESNSTTAKVWTGVEAVNCFVEAEIADNQIAMPSGAVSLTIASMTGGYSIKVNGGTNNGKYIYGKSGSNEVDFGADPSVNTLSINNNSAIITSNTSIMMYNSNSGQDRFRYYKTGSSQKSVQLYKKVEAYTIANFVTDWNTATNAACSNPDADNETAITAAWPGIKTNYLKLSLADQAKVAAGEDPTPASLIERYDHIVVRYALENFMNRSVTPSTRINVFNTMNDNGSIAIIVIVSLLSVTAIGGYFFIRRRKEN